MSKMVQNVGEGVIPKAIQTITMAQRRGRRPASPVGVGTPPRRQAPCLDKKMEIYQPKKGISLVAWTFDWNLFRYITSI